MNKFMNETQLSLPDLCCHVASGVANGPLKNTGLAKFKPIFMGRAVSFFQRLSVSRSLDCLTKLSRSLDLLSSRSVSEY